MLIYSLLVGTVPPPNPPLLLPSKQGLVASHHAPTCLRLVPVSTKKTALARFLATRATSFFSTTSVGLEEKAWFGGMKTD